MLQLEEKENAIQQMKGSDQEKDKVIRQMGSALQEKGSVLQEKERFINVQVEVKPIVWRFGPSSLLYL